MERHVDLLGRLLVIAGLLQGLVAVAVLSLGVAAGAIARSGPAETYVAASATAATFIGAAVLIMAWGAANGAAGVGLRRHRPSARTAGLVLTVLNVFVLPFGTALSFYTTWVLLNDESRRLFHPHIAEAP